MGAGEAAGGEAARGGGSGELVARRVRRVTRTVAAAGLAFAGGAAGWAGEEARDGDPRAGDCGGGAARGARRQGRWASTAESRVAVGGGWWRRRLAVGRARGRERARGRAAGHDGEAGPSACGGRRLGRPSTSSAGGSMAAASVARAPVLAWRRSHLVGRLGEARAARTAGGGRVERRQAVEHLATAPAVEGVGAARFESGARRPPRRLAPLPLGGHHWQLSGRRAASDWATSGPTARPAALLPPSRCPTAGRHRLWRWGGAYRGGSWRQGGRAVAHAKRAEDLVVLVHERSVEARVERLARLSRQLLAFALLGPQ